MLPSWVSLEVEKLGEARIAVVRFDRGHASNTMSVALCRELRRAALSFEEDATLTAVILTDRAVSHADFDQFGLAVASGDYAEGVSSFLEKRPPRYTGA